MFICIHLNILYRRRGSFTLPWLVWL